MLTLLNISNVALIDELRTEFDRGLNLLTGETGSGKSIIVDALGVLIGGRFTSDLLKAGAQQAFIEGLFSVERNPEMEAKLAAAGIEMARSADQGAETNEIIIRRELSAVGKNKIFINNQLATQSLLRDLRQFLVDIHGQGDQQTLFNPEMHLELLDAFAPVAALRQEVADFYQRWDGLKRELNELQQDEAEKFQLIDLLRFQIDELERAQLGALSNADAKHFHGRLPTWNNFVNHPNYDSFWKKEALDYQLRPLTVPTMHVGGWWDQEDFYGPLRAYEVLEKTDTDHLNYVVVGPWNHGGWERRDGDKLGNVDFGMPTSKYFREKIRAPWFAHFLKDKGDWNQLEAITFETGLNQWMSYDSWPPRKDITQRNLYFRNAGHLSFDPPAQNGPHEFDTYVSDPAHPVPYRARPVEPTYNPPANGGSRWSTWLLEDQRFVQGRSDVLTWETESLKEDLTISGDIVVHIFAATSGTDSDFVVKLIDVFPEEYPKDPKMGGYELMIADEILRARFWKSFEKPQPIMPNRVNEYLIDLHTNDHRFMKGHRIMVQAQSTWFPLYDRNPQKFVVNIFRAKDSDYEVATQRIFRSKAFPSHITLPVRGD